MRDNKEMTLEEISVLKALAQKLESEDFSTFSHKEAVRTKVLKNIRENEVNPMKKVRNFKKPAVAVASLAIGMTLFAQTAIAKDFAQKIKEVFSIASGNINIIQEEAREKSESEFVPESLQGKLFDAEGNEIKEFPESIIPLFTKSGEKIAYISNDENNELIIVTEAMQTAEREKTLLILNDASELNSYMAFDVRLPKYLPEGYKFNHIEVYKDDEGKAGNSKYIDIYYVNESTGELIFMQQRFAEKETAYTIGTDGTVERVQINGAEAFVMDERSVDWEADGVLYHINGRGAFSKDELLKIAGSI